MPPSHTDAAPGSGLMTALVGVTGVLTVGCLLMAVSHAGLRVPLIAGLGPAGGAAVPPAAAGFGVVTVAYAVVLGGLLRRRPWAWALGLVVYGVTLAGASMPFRGAGSAVGIALSALALALLLSPSVRRALLPDRGAAA